MGEIGKRAADAIRRTAEKNGTSYAFELDCIGVSREMLYSWEHRKYEPTGKKLQGMAHAGYDVHYILTGKERTNEN